MKVRPPRFHIFKTNSSELLYFYIGTAVITEN